jgi:TRAP-type mannitol/chloroaromatic compound transport system permease large subunit
LGTVGLLLLAFALALMMTTGWPTYAVLIAVSTLGALFGIGIGAFDASLLRTLPGRIIGLLENDLLQALALYALVGALLNHLAIADGLYGGLRKTIGRCTRRGASELAGLGLGSLLAPMNGSVGASLLTLSRTAGARWARQGMPAERRTALFAVASTLGVIVPPSLVLLLLGDAMMRAHTEGLHLAQSLSLPAATLGTRVINTQDVLQAALLPGAVLLACWAAASWFAAPAAPLEAQPPPLLRRERWSLLVVPLLIGGLLALVAAGRVRPVEAAASAGLLLLAWGLVSRQLTGAVLRQVLDDALALTGTLFALLVAATTFSLLLRAFGTDLLVAGWMQRLQGQPLLAVLTVLAVLLSCTFVLDAFELIFLVVPIVMPPLLALVDDAAWVAALTLLVLQAGFLVPPFGYAVVLARGQLRPRPPAAALARALLPYLLCLLAVLALVIAVPATTRWLRTVPSTLPASTMSPEELDQRMHEMAPPETPNEEADPAQPAR